MASIESRAMRAPSAHPPGQTASHSEILTAIGRSLQRVYAPMVEAPLPDYFAQFLAKIEQRQVEAKH